MQNQLAHVPSEYQTCQRLFTIHIAERYRCIDRVCGKVSDNYAWRSAAQMVAHIYTMKRGDPVTLKGGISRQLRSRTLTVENSSKMVTGTCDYCRQTSIPLDEIINAPEILFVIPQRSDGADDKRTIVQMEENLSLSSLTEGKKELQYRLQGAVLLHTHPEILHTTALIRGPDKDFYEANDAIVKHVPRGISWAEEQQRRPTDSKQQVELDVLVYVRCDDRDSNRVEIDPTAEPDADQGADSPRTLLAARKMQKSVQVRVLEDVGDASLEAQITVYPGEPDDEQHPPSTINLNMDIEYRLHGRAWKSTATGPMFIVTRASQPQKPTTTGDSIDVARIPASTTAPQLATPAKSATSSRAHGAPSTASPSRKRKFANSGFKIDPAPARKRR